MTAARATKKLTSTAYHEAGHAVACIFAAGQAIRFREASIVPDKDEGSLGHVLQRKPPAWVLREIEAGPYKSARAERWLMNQAMVLLAGAAAADRYHGRRGNRGSAVYLSHPKRGRLLVDGDLYNATEWLRRIANGDPEEASLLYPLADYRARRLVSVRWDSVVRVAEALLERGTLTEAEVSECVWAPRPGSLVAAMLDRARAREAEARQ